MGDDLLPILFGALVSPALTAACKRARWARNIQAWAAVNLSASVALALFLWLLVDRDPAHARQWIVWGLAAGGVGQTANNVYRKRRKSARPPPIRRLIGRR